MGQHPPALTRPATYGDRGDLHLGGGAFRKRSARGVVGNAGLSPASGRSRARDARRERSSDIARLAAIAGPFDGYFFAQLLPELLALAPTHVGFSLTFSSQIAATFRWATLLRERLPGARLVLGGALVSCWSAVGAD